MTVVPEFSGEAVLGVDYTVVKDTLTINPGGLSDSILVTALSDNLVEMDEQVQAAIVSAQNAQFEPTTVVMLTITDQDQAISFGSLAAKKYGDAGFMLDGSSTSGLEVVFTSSDEGVAKITGNQVKITGSGMATITASQPGNSLFDLAVEVAQTLTVGKAPLTASAQNKEKVYGQANPVLTVSYTGFMNGDGEAVLDTKPSVATTAATLSNAGDYPITVSGGSDGNYDLVYASGTLTINKAPQAITFGELPGVKKGDAPLALTATSTSGLVVTFESSDPTKATISGSSAVIVNSGTVQVTAKQGGDMNYLPAADVTRALVIKNPDGIEQLKVTGPLCYPNPFDRVICLDQVCQKALSVKIYDVNGKLVLTRGPKENQIDCAVLRAGVYLLEADFGKGMKVKQQVVKK